MDGKTLIKSQFPSERHWATDNEGHQVSRYFSVFALK